MKIAKWIVAAAALAFAVPAHAAVGDPLKVLYLYAGVLEDNNLIATVVQCTSFSGVTENIQFAAKDKAGTLKGVNTSINVVSSGTIIAATRDVFFLAEDLVITTGVFQGTLAVLATSVNIVCGATILQSNTTNATGYPLHGMRFNLVPGTQE